jgi:hypothetical protein
MRRFHRLFGAATAVAVILMVISGLTLNHSHHLGLDQRDVSQSYLLDWYGFGESEQIRSFAVGSDWLSFAGSQLYLNGKPVSTVRDGVGAINKGDMLIAAGSDELVLLDPAGNMIERIPWGPVHAGPIEALGLLDNTTAAIRSANQFWVADAQLLDWQRIEEAAENPQWASPEPAPRAIQDAIRQHYHGNGLSAERVLLDFHSGRIFGPIGVLVYDLFTLAVGFLAISGLVLWVRGRRNGNRNGNGRSRDQRR